MSQPTLTQCSCTKTGGRCEEDCNCCDSPYAIENCTCDCLARKLAVIFDLALAEDAAFAACELLKDEEPAYPLALGNGPVSGTLSWTAQYNAWVELSFFTGIPPLAFSSIISGGGL